MLQSFVAWFTDAIVYGSILMLGALGELYNEKAGNLNLGTPGIIAVGAAGAFVGAFRYESACVAAGREPSVFWCVFLPLLCAFVASVLTGAIYAFLTVSLRANQNVTGLTLTVFGVGTAKFFGAFAIPKGNTANAVPAVNGVYSAGIRTLLGGRSGVIGDLFFSYGFMLYLTLALAVFSIWFFKRTRTGLSLRAVGESPATADAMGVNVTKYKYFAILSGAGISGLGGAYYVLDFGNGIWSTATVANIEALGWLSVALVIFAIWRPVNLIWGAYLFGFCYWAYQYLPSLIGVEINTEISQMAPYLVTIVVLIAVSLRRKREDQGPAALGLSYFREDR